MSDRPAPSPAALLDTMPFARTCGIELTEAGPERATGSTIVHRVVEAAYGAFSRGLTISLEIAAALMLLGAALSAMTVARKTVQRHTAGSR